MLLSQRLEPVGSGIGLAARVGQWRPIVRVVVGQLQGSCMTLVHRHACQRCKLGEAGVTPEWNKWSVMRGESKERGYYRSHDHYQG